MKFLSSSKVRESNFELLRIMAMIMIILHHFVVHSSYVLPCGQELTFNDGVLSFFQAGGKLGVVLFSMVTGYYMVESKARFKKLIGLELQVLFYSITFMLLFWGVGLLQLGRKELITYLFPNISNTYWFFSSYFIMYLLIPYINKLIMAMQKDEFFKLLVILFVILILFPSLFIYNGRFDQGIYLIYYYMVGAYIKLYGVSRKRKNIKYLSGFALSYLVIILASLVIRYLSCSYGVMGQYIYFLSRTDSILIFSSALCLFEFFKNLQIKNNVLINLLSSVSFGVYLFHDHPLVRELLWKRIFLVGNFIDSPLFLIIGIVIAVIVYLSGGCLELFRKMLFKGGKFFISCLKGSSEE